MLQYRVGLVFGAATVAGEEHGIFVPVYYKMYFRCLFWTPCVWDRTHERSGKFGGLVVDICELRPGVVIIISITALTDH
jgi:hypothetical protein